MSTQPELEYIGELRRRAEAYSVALAALARQEDAVTKYRADCLDGKVLDTASAISFFRNPAFGVFSAQELGGLRGGPSAFVLEDWKESREGAEPSKGVTFRYEARITGSSEPIQKALRYVPESTSLTGEEEAISLRWTSNTIAFPGERDVDRRFVQPGSVLDRLRLVGKHLSEVFPWDEYQATWFVVTDSPPAAPVLGCEVRRENASGVLFAQLIIRSAPWVAPSDISAWYQRAQSRLLSRPRLRDRIPGEQSRHVFQFVVTRRPELLVRKGGRERNDGDERPLWKQLLNEWNRSESALTNGWCYDGDDALRTGFIPAFRRWRDLLFPELEHPFVSS
jgi:hypothetical protein